MVDIVATISSILSSFGDYPLYLIILFIAIIIVAIKITKLIFGLGIAAVVGAVFPVIINDVLKVSGLVEPGFKSSLTFAVLAVIVYGLYSLLVMLYGLLKTTGKAASLPVRVLAFVGEVTIKLLKFLGQLVITPIKFIGRMISDLKGTSKEDKREGKDEKNKKGYKEHKTDESDEEFWKGREKLASDEYDGSDDIYVEKTEEHIDDQSVAKNVKKDNNSFLSQVYSNYEEFEKDKKKKKE
ncbi:MAG: hypothetical protein K0B07_04615 [DPANN group archaeon]|nr:hypothetical protein [DPANN group archaeon]